MQKTLTNHNVLYCLFNWPLTTWVGCKRQCFSFIICVMQEIDYTVTAERMMVRVTERVAFDTGQWPLLSDSHLPKGVLACVRALQHTGLELIRFRAHYIAQCSPHCSSHCSLLTKLLGARYIAHCSQHCSLLITLLIAHQIARCSLICSLLITLLTAQQIAHCSTHCSVLTTLFSAHERKWSGEESLVNFSSQVGTEPGTFSQHISRHHWGYRGFRFHSCTRI